MDKQVQTEARKPYGFIYLIRNMVNGKVYIGQTIQTIRQRWQEHIEKSRCGNEKRRRNSPVLLAIRKYGPGSFQVCELAQGSSWEELDSLEIFWINTFCACDPEIGYNRTTGGQGKGLQLAFTISDEARKVISLASSNYWSSADNRQKQSEALTAWWADPENNGRESAKRKKRDNTPEMKAIKKAAQLRPDVVAKKRKATKEQWADPEFASLKRRQAKEQWSDPVRVAKLKEVLNSPAVKTKRSVIQKAIWADPVYKANRVAKRKALEATKALAAITLPAQSVPLQ